MLGQHFFGQQVGLQLGCLRLTQPIIGHTALIINRRTLRLHRLLVNNQQLARSFRQLLSPAMQHGRLIIHNLQIAARHQLRKHKVYPGQHLGLAAEVFIQINAFAAVLLSISRKFAHKQRRLGQTEAINALLDVSHHKTVRAAAQH